MLCHGPMQSFLNRTVKALVSGTAQLWASAALHICMHPSSRANPLLSLFLTGYQQYRKYCSGSLSAAELWEATVGGQIKLSNHRSHTVQGLTGSLEPETLISPLLKFTTIRRNKQYRVTWLNSILYSVVNDAVSMAFKRLAPVSRKAVTLQVLSAKRGRGT